MSDCAICGGIARSRGGRPRRYCGDRRAGDWCPAEPTLAWTWRQWHALDFAAAVRYRVIRRRQERVA